MVSTVIGEEIKINNGKNMKGSINIEGNTYQEVEDGKNKAIIPDREETFNGMSINIKNGIINITGKSSVTYTSYRIVGSAELEAGKTYYLRLFGNKSGSASLRNDTESVWFPDSENNENQFTPTVGGTYNIQLGFGSGENQNWNARYSISETSNADWVEGKEQKPTLENPSEVEAVGDNTNLFDGKTELGSYNSSGNKINVDDTIRNINPINVKGINTIIFSCNGEGIAINVFEYNSENKIIKFTTYQANTVITLNSNTAYINFSRSNNLDVSKIQVQKGNIITPFGYGGVEIVASNKNLLSFEYRAGNGITFDKNKITIIDPTGYLYAGNNTLGGNKFLSGKTINLSLIANGTINGNNNIEFTIHTNKRSYVVSQYYFKGNFKDDLFTKKIVLANDEVIGSITVYTLGTTGNLTIDVQVEISDEATDLVEHKGNTYTIPVQKPFYKLGDYKDSFIRQNNKRYEQHNIKELIFTGNENWSKSTAINAINRFTLIITDLLNGMPETADTFSNSFKAIKYSDAQSQLGITHNSQLLIINHSFSENETITLEQFKTKLQNLYNAGTPVKVYYVLAIPELIECTEEQSQILEQLNNLYLYEGMNYIYSTNELSPIFQFSYDKIINDFKFYLSENGRLIFPNENISFLCSISESSIPSMPEALETSATIAGRDGDVSLSTTYGPMSFELVLYTEDNLTPEEKLKQEIFLNRFCNSIKNSTETFALELAQKFYKIKYNGLLNKENYPKFLRFTLPFKSSKSFAYDVKKYIIYGNSTVESNTIEPTGFECVIKGPAIKPIISLNDYSIEYNNTILDDESLIIDTNNSTAVLVNSEGTRVNAMRYYNHQFPKILNGENELKILSGIDNPENVSISWYDLTL